MILLKPTQGKHCNNTHDGSYHVSFRFWNHPYGIVSFDHEHGSYHGVFEGIDHEGCHGDVSKESGVFAKREQNDVHVLHW